MIANPSAEIPELSELVRLAQVPAMLPRRPDGKKTSLVTIYRWINKGCRGAKLQAWNLGGATFTTHEAVARFIAATTEARGLCVEHPSTRSPAKRNRDHAKAEQNLKQSGW